MMKNQMHKYFIKNTLLLSTFILSQIHTLFYGSNQRVDWYLLIEHTRRIDYAVMYTSIAVNFLILAFCLHYPKGVSKNVTRFILIISTLDLFHLILLSKMGFGMTKIGIALIIYVVYVLIFKRNGRN